MADEFPGNSFAAKQVKVTEEGLEPKTSSDSQTQKTEPVISGKVEQRKKTLGARFKQHFVTEGEGFFDHIVEKVIIPKSLELFNTIVAQTADAFKQGVEEALFGGRANRPTAAPPRPGFVQRTNYNGVTAPSTTTAYYQPVARPSNIVKDVVLEFREDVELVLDILRGAIERDGFCTLGDFYSHVRIQSNPVDEEWGWTNLASARSRQVNGGYLVVLPRLEHLDLRRR